jgi:hypothetical protein
VAGEGKKIEEEMTMLPPEINSKSDPVAIVDPLEMQSLTPATTKEASDILINCRNGF